MRGNGAALHVADAYDKFPLHIACQYCSADIVKFWVDLDCSNLTQCDVNGNYPIHLACVEGNCNVIKYLLKRHVAYVSESNDDGKLPFHLLTEFGADKAGRTSVEYTEALFLLRQTHPETVLEVRMARKRKK